MLYANECTCIHVYAQNVVLSQEFSLVLTEVNAKSSMCMLYTCSNVGFHARFLPCFNWMWMQDKPFVQQHVYSHSSVVNMLVVFPMFNP